jgi:hypothetical protein
MVLFSLLEKECRKEGLVCGQDSGGRWRHGMLFTMPFDIVLIKDAIVKEGLILDDLDDLVVFKRFPDLLPLIPRKGGNPYIFYPLKYFRLSLHDSLFSFMLV